MSNLFDDKDIKIAGNKPSLDIKKNSFNPISESKMEAENHQNAKEWGRAVALEFVGDANTNSLDKETDFDMAIQRRLLLSFTATVGFEKFSSSDILCGLAQKSFIDTLKKENEELYKTSQDTGAFSFYYLAFRRGGDTERRMGQTFAMLCSHDGDGVYQELGEALYCWFLSVVKNNAQKFNIN